MLGSHGAHTLTLSLSLSFFFSFLSFSSPPKQSKWSRVLANFVFQLSSNESESGNFSPLFIPQSPVKATLSDEDDGFIDLLDGENMKVQSVGVGVSVHSNQPAEAS